jgi:hypothetical protein
MRFVRPEALKNHAWEMASHSQPALARHFNFGEHRPMSM